LVLPILAYGDPVLKRMSEEIEPDHPELESLIENMFETMYQASGVGLAAPQIGQNIRLFIVDASPFAEDEELPEEDRETLKDFKKVFINAEIIEEEGDPWEFEEGCLSIPDIRERVKREERIRIIYEDENFQEHDEVLTGLAARVVQHEYDHIEGILFTDRIGAFRRRLLKGRLDDIKNGRIDVRYRMRFPKKKR
jgi:peptide deformylase